MNNSVAVGVDIGGSHITAALVDLRRGKIVSGSLKREHVNSKGSAAGIIRGWADVIRHCYAGQPAVSKKIGMAMPGPFEYELGISLIKGLDKFEALYGLNIKKLLATELNIESQDILLMNDASCFLRGEVFVGTVADCNNIVGITLGTGLGSARYHSGQFFDGDLYCSAFKNGTAEDYLSSRWFLRRYKELTGISVESVKELGKNSSIDPLIKSMFAEFGGNLGEVLKTFIQKHTCETIIIGGNIINASQLFFPETEIILNTLPKPVSITKARLGEESALIGAASLWN